MNRPRWRWWLFRASLWLGFRTGWRWAWVGRLYSWSVLPEWLATQEEIEACQAGYRECPACRGCGEIPDWGTPIDMGAGERREKCSTCGGWGDVAVREFPEVRHG